ncbi:MAG TPA: hypothetical protein PKM35_07240 [Holophaga sp.]|nr:hypothetical protein [Holophaga sp.]
MKHYVVTCTLRIPIESVGEDLLDQHLAMMQKGYEEGYILLYGPLEPENGTLAIARVESPAALGRALASDPLLAAGIASYDFREFIPIRFPSSLSGWVDPLGFHPRGSQEPDA